MYKIVSVCGTIRPIDTEKRRENWTTIKNWWISQIFSYPISPRIALPQRHKTTQNTEKWYLSNNNSFRYYTKCQRDVVCLNQITNQLLSIELISVLAFPFISQQKYFIVWYKWWMYRIVRRYRKSVYKIVLKFIFNSLFSLLEFPHRIFFEASIFFSINNFSNEPIKIDQIIEKVSFYEWRMDYNFLQLSLWCHEHTHYVAQCISMTSIHSIFLAILILWRNCKLRFNVIFRSHERRNSSPFLFLLMLVLFYSVCYCEPLR